MQGGCFSSRRVEAIDEVVFAVRQLDTVLVSIARIPSIIQIAPARFGGHTKVEHVRGET